jgi:hypothetical protein
MCWGLLNSNFLNTVVCCVFLNGLPKDKLEEYVGMLWIKTLQSLNQRKEEEKEML